MKDYNVYKINNKVKLIDYGITYYDFNNEKLRLNENIKIMNYELIFRIIKI